jgi:hypothetical protein
MVDSSLPIAWVPDLLRLLSLTLEIAVHSSEHLADW